MATSNGPWQNHARIEWVYTVPGVSRSTTKLTASVEAYFRMESSGGWNQQYNGWKAWSGHWGSGGASQGYHLGPGQRVRLVHGGGGAVTLTDSWQTRTFAVHADHYFGRTGSTLTVRFPPRYARTPSSLKVKRNSDGSQTLNWTRNSTYTSVVVQRRDNGGSWKQVGKPSGNAYTFTDTTTVANRRYDYRVAGIGGSGQSDWSGTATIYTTPAAPSTVTATRSGDDIRVSLSGLPSYASHFDVYDEGTLVGSAIPRASFPWTHKAPNPAITHRYRVRSRQSSGGTSSSVLISGYSSYSNTVQLAAAPNAPGDLTPNGGVLEAGANFRMSWTHTPVDSSEQSAAEVRYRLVGGDWTTASLLTDESYYVNLDPGDYEWQVRTKGTHPDWSAWSATAAFTVATTPGVAIIGPPAVLNDSRVTVEWTWYQEEERPQSAWEARLLRFDEVLETAVGTDGATQFDFETPLEDLYAYTVEVRAATGTLWSEWAVHEFKTEFLPAAPPTISVEWDEGTGHHQIDVRPERATMYQWNGLPYESPSVKHVEGDEPILNYVPNPGFAAEREQRFNLFPDPEAANPQSWTYGSEGSGELGPCTTSIQSTESSGYDPAVVEIPLPGLENGKTYTVSAWVRLPEHVTVEQVLNEDGITLGIARTLTAGPASLVPGESNRFYWTVERDSTLTDLEFYLAAWTVPGDLVFEISGILVEEGDTVGDWFSGDSEGARWNGRRHASVSTWSAPVEIELYRNLFTNPRFVGDGTWAEVARFPTGSPPPEVAQPEDFSIRDLGTGESVMEIERVRGLTGSNCVAGVSTRNGKPAVRLIPTGSGLSLAMAVIPVTASSVTGVATVSLDAPLQGTLDDFALTIDAGGANVAAPNLAGDHPLRVTGGEPTGGVVAIALTNGATLGNGDVWWTDVGLFAGNYTGPFFHGGMDESPDPDMWVGWAGEPDDSPSVMKASPVHNIETVNAFAIVSSQFGGSMRLIASDRAGTVLPGEPARAGFQLPSGTTFAGTLRANMHVLEDAVGDGSTEYPARALVLRPGDSNSGIGPDKPGSHVRRLSAPSGVDSIWFVHGGSEGAPDVYWSQAMLVEGDVVGDYFDGSTQSTLPTQYMYVERSLDREHWELVLDNIEEAITFADGEGRSNGITWYRLTAVTALPSKTSTLVSARSTSGAVWLSGGVKFGRVARLPFNAQTEIVGGRARSVRHYEGRSRPVAYAGSQLTRTVHVVGSIDDSRDDNVSIDEFVDLAQDPYPLHQYRDSDGRRIRGVLSDVSLPREFTTTTGALWQYGFSLEEADT